MKRILSVILILAFCFSLNSQIVFGASDTTGSSESAPVVLNSTNNTFEIEGENFSWASSGYEKVLDLSASGYYAVKSSGSDTVCPLWIKSEESVKIKIFARVKYIHEGVQPPYTYNTKVMTNGEAIERNPYIKSLNEYEWVCLDSCEVQKNTPFQIGFFHISGRAYVDKYVITSDISKFPVDKSRTEVSYTDMYDFTYGKDYYTIPDGLPTVPNSERPRILVNNSILSGIRARIADESHAETQQVYSSLLKKASEVPADYTFSKSVPYIYSNAFLSVLSENEADKEKHANLAVSALKEANKLNSSMPLRTGTGKDGYNARAFRVYITSIIYDWCYDYLSEDDRKALIHEMLFYISQLEYSYPPINIHGRNNGHESESDILVAMFSSALAIYEEADAGYNGMFNVIYNKIAQEMLDTRNYYYKMGNHTQGTHYNASRLSIESRFMALLNSAFGEGLIEDGADQILMEYIYGQRPDNSFMRNGDSDGEGLREGPNAVAKPFFMYGNYYNNPYIKNEYYRMKYGKNIFS